MRLKLLRRAALALLFSTALAGDAAAQAGRVGGIVRDDSGEPIRGATVSAENPDHGITALTATTDERGRFTMIGLRTGLWRFVAQAPGHAAQGGELSVRYATPNPPLTFTLRRNGPPPNSPLGGVSARELQSALAAADALYNQQQWDQAIAAYGTILARTPVLSVINLQIAAAYRHKKDYDAAIATYETLLAADPGNQKAAVGIGHVHMERGDPQTAETALTAAAASEAAGREVLYALGDVKLAQGDDMQAAAWYQKAADADPSWGKPLYKLGVISLKNGDREGAARFMDLVVTVDPVSPEAALAKASLNELNR
jgi:Tfp pilus assembly protein PilF